MSAEILRKAAALMRSRAEAATPGPWARVGDSSWIDGGRNLYEEVVAPAEVECGSYCQGGSSRITTTAPDAEHIASWHPAVALAVADWLDMVAEARATIDGVEMARSRNGSGWLTPKDTASQCFRDMEQHALAVATAYLGTEQ